MVTGVCLSQVPSITVYSSVIFNIFLMPIFRVSYRDGVMEHEPRPCAAVRGTQIMVGQSALFWYHYMLYKFLIDFLCDFVYYLCHGIFLIIKVHLFQVENLFYNMIARRKTLQNSNDDYAKIIDLISRLAVHNISVSFSCRKVSQHLMLQ